MDLENYVIVKNKHLNEKDVYNLLSIGEITKQVLFQQVLRPRDEIEIEGDVKKLLEVLDEYLDSLQSWLSSIGALEDYQIRTRSLRGRANLLTGYILNNIKGKDFDDFLKDTALYSLVEKVGDKKAKEVYERLEKKLKKLFIETK